MSSSHYSSYRDERAEGVALPMRDSRDSRDPRGGGGGGPGGGGSGVPRTSRSESPLPPPRQRRTRHNKERNVGEEEDDVSSRSRSRSPPPAVADTVAMIANMKPYLHSDTFVFTILPYEAGAALPALLPHLHSLTTEEEGMSLIIPRSVAKEHGLPTNLSPRMKHIELTIRSSLMGVGLTAAVSSALGAGEIPCNIVAGLNHDHVFVPEESAELAMDVLKALSKQSRKIERGERRAPWDEDAQGRDPAEAPAKSAREERRERRKEEGV